MKKPYCPQGHEYVDANMYLRSDGRIECRICKNKRSNAARSRKAKHLINNRWKTNGMSLSERLDHYSMREPNTGCWIWTAHSGKYGHGSLSVNGKIHAAYRLSYELYVGKIPDGLVLDHLCRNPYCINPQHLEPVTITINNKRRPKPEVCKNGHEMTPDNRFFFGDGTRVTCNICRLKSRRESKKRSYLKKVATWQK